ncbi:next to BRCA1 gene 1 protein-like isoform X2 [Hetaerina americana]|uniref:next to BRCA1 gene 1 protein-like isoform X2 n=1 Tax=Hetaerina americana TaxID=62018 RepID=UPI003A7F4528
MIEDMDSKGIYFDLQWKTKSGSSNAEEFGSIGIWEVDDSSLDWFTFKPYLCQTLGNVENVSISYIDSDGDEIPIDSDLEFQEALKFARRRAALKQKIVLKVEKLGTQSGAPGGAEILSNPIYLRPSNFLKQRLKINCHAEEQDFLNASTVDEPIKVGNSACKVKTKPKSKDVICPLQTCDVPPLWFRKYMKKMKSEIVCEVTANVNNQMKKLLEDMGRKGQPVLFPTGSVNSNGNFGAAGKSSAWLVTKTKKKTSDDDSSDGAQKIEIKDSKILKKIEKLHRCEKKMDHKKEKLELKAKKLAEKKEREYLSKLWLEIAGCKEVKVGNSSYKKIRQPEFTPAQRPKVNTCEPPRNNIPPRDPEVANMGVFVNSDDVRIMSVKRGSNFTKVWKVINTGDFQWTDETEVKLSWGNAGLNPEALSVKCPLLAPGEVGEIAINFSSPSFPGIFESHWHFYHKNIRFGGRMSCIISVDLIKSDDETNSESRQPSLSSSSSTEFIVVPPTALSVDGNNVKAGDEGTQDGTTAIDVVPSGSTKHDETLIKLNTISLASGPWVNDKEFMIDEVCTCNEDKEAELESISPDDMSGSEHSLESDSDDNFVVVPMPPCFRIDIPLNSEGLNPGKTDSAEVVKDMDEPENSIADETHESSSVHLPSAPLGPCLDDGNALAPDYCHSSEMPVQREVSHDTGEVISVPLKPLQPKASVSKLQFQPAVTHMLPKCPIPEPRVVILNKSDPSPSNPPPTTWNAFMSTSADLSSSSAASSSSAMPSSSRSQESLQSNERESGADQSDNIPQAKTTPRSSPSSSRPIDLKPRIMTEVTLGTVYNESSNRQPQRPKSTSREDPPPPPIDPVMADGLTKLVNMGFVDLELNQALLRVYNHNLPEVIEALLNGRP